MDDDHDHESDEESHEQAEPLETIESSTETANKVVDVISKANEGNAGGATASGMAAGAGVLETVAGALNEDMGVEKDVLEGVAQVLEVTEKVVEGVEKIDHMRHGGEHDEHAQGRHGRQDDHGPTPEELTQQHAATGNVHYDVDIEGVDATLVLRSVVFEDGVSDIPSCHLELEAEEMTFAEETELFDKEVSFSFDRGQNQRMFRGMVRAAHLNATRNRQVVTLDVVPAMWLLTQTQDSRVFQDKTVPEVVQELVEELLANRGRSVRLELANEGDYPTHEYLVQYRESHYQFLRRLCDEEGIWFYFDHAEGDHEVLVLADSNDNRPRITGGRDGLVDYVEEGGDQAENEVAYGFHRSRWVGPTDAVVTDYDWTNPDLTVRDEQTERGENRGPRLETHHHDNATRFHAYDDGGGQYREHSTTRRAQHAAERHDLARARWSCETTVVGVEPGHVIELQGADSHDGRYLVLRVSGVGTPGARAGGYSASLELVPIETPYRPSRPETPLAHGPETATVVGPAGEEIHVDRHGRVKVQFHWDRLGQRDEHAGTWIRVAQFWSGPGWGSMFIPRIGTEVIVSFLGGDPDRPVITGRLYNGTHPVPYALPDHKTRSTIKTRSTPNSEGYNELRFEDKAGEEEVFIHAEKDFNEVVKNCHSTHVGVDQSNTVDRDQREKIERDQYLHVVNNREKLIDENETTYIKGTRTETVVGVEKVNVKDKRRHHIEVDDITIVDQHRTTQVGKKYTITSGEQYKIVENEDNQLRIDDCIHGITKGDVRWEAGDGVVWVAEPGGRLSTNASEKVIVEAGDDVVTKTPEKIITEAKKMTFKADAEITLQVGNSKIKITEGSIEITAPSVKVQSTSGITEIKSVSDVKINC